VPDHIDARISECSGDQMLDGSSFISHKRLVNRGVALDKLAATAAGTGGSVRAEGVRESRVRPAILWGLGAIAVGLLGIVRSIRRAYWFALLAGAALLAPFAARSQDVRSGDESVPIAWTGVVDGDKTMASRFLCGPDALYVVTRLLGRECVFPELIRWVRPGMDGATLSQLQVAAECIGLTPSVSMSRDWASPPSPSIAHIFGDHFAVLVRRSDGRVDVCDPVSGIRSAPWSSLQQVIDMIMAVEQ
jgi:hypothetical protein